MRSGAFGVVVLAGCSAGAGARGPVAPLRSACAAGQYWDGRACAAAGDAPARLAEGQQALDAQNVDDAKLALEAAEKAGPLDREHHIALWEQRAIASAYVDDTAGAERAFEMLLALDPGHFVSYRVAPKATLLFEKLRTRKDRVAPEVDVSWQRQTKVGEPVPIAIDVLADPESFLRTATLFVRTRGEASWRATDLALHPGEQRIVLPAIEAQKNLSLEVYLRAYDDHHNEVLAWADPARPREIALRYDPPQPWYRTWWGITAIGGVLATAAGVTVYELTLAPPDKVGGSVTIK